MTRIVDALSGLPVWRLHQLEPRLLSDKIADFISREATLPEYRFRDPLDVRPMAFYDPLRPGELLGQYFVNARMQEAIEPKA